MRPVGSYPSQAVELRALASVGPKAARQTLRSVSQILTPAE
ncbi:hypothetical protein GGD66_002187 [Bradyrhizobium sp. CIR48]|nr:hypothetical protein [Bradyrhizobium sp. CIR48]